MIIIFMSNNTNTQQKFPTIVERERYCCRAMMAERKRCGLTVLQLHHYNVTSGVTSLADA